MKYNPYKGYHHIPYYVWPCPRRIRTKGDWRLNYERTPWVHATWKRFGRHNSNDSHYEKAFLHRQFRRHVKYAIWRELGGDDGVSHAFWESGNWLD